MCATFPEHIDVLSTLALYQGRVQREDELLLKCEKGIGA